MAVLPDTDRYDLWSAWMRDLSHSETLGAVTKADIRAAVNALDDFLSTNAVAINNSIPQPARSELTVKQKALLLVYVIKKRYLAEV